MTHKLCHRCERLLPISAFKDRKKPKDGKPIKYNQCKRCIKEMRFIWYNNKKKREEKLVTQSAQDNKAREARINYYRERVKLGLPLDSKELYYA